VTPVSQFGRRVGTAPFGSRFLLAGGVGWRRRVRAGVAVVVGAVQEDLVQEHGAGLDVVFVEGRENDLGEFGDAHGLI